MREVCRLLCCLAYYLMDFARIWNSPYTHLCSTLSQEESPLDSKDSWLVFFTFGYQSNLPWWKLYNLLHSMKEIRDGYAGHTCNHNQLIHRLRYLDYQSWGLSHFLSPTWRAQFLEQHICKNFLLSPQKSDCGFNKAKALQYLDNLPKL